MNKIIIAIDGYSACGKSTTAKYVAHRLGYTYIDSGAMYRAVSLFLLQMKIPFQEDGDHIQNALQNIYIEQKLKQEEMGIDTYLNGEKVEDQLRTQAISQVVSQVSTLASVREEMVSQQRRMGEEKGVVMDGRDIGTVVFPFAELKLFMIADLRIRAMRRKKEYEEKGVEASLEEIEKNLRERDYIDSHRKISPLKQAPDARVIDTSYITIERQVDLVCELAQEILTS